MIADAVRDATIAFYNHNTGKERDKARKQQLMPYIVTMAEAVRAKMGVYCIESNAMQCNAMDRMERLEYLERDRNTVGEFMATIKSGSARDTPRVESARWCESPAMCPRRSHCGTMGCAPSGRGTTPASGEWVGDRDACRSLDTSGDANFRNRAGTRYDTILCRSV